MLPWRLILAKASHSPNQGFRERLAGKSREACNFHSSPGSDYHESSAGSTPLSERGPFVSRLKSCGVLRFDDSDAVKYLQGLVTSDLRWFEDPPSDAWLSVPTPNQPEAFSGPIYVALLTPHGRFWYDLFIYRPIKAEEKFDRTSSGLGGESHQPSLLADVDIHLLDELLDHLKNSDWGWLEPGRKREVDEILQDNIDDCYEKKDYEIVVAICLVLSTLTHGMRSTRRRSKFLFKLLGQ